LSDGIAWCPYTLGKTCQYRSGSDAAAGLRAVASLLEPELSVLGFDVRRVPAKEPDGEYSIIATREGTGEKSALVMAHMDTVFSAGTVATWPFAVKGDWAHGPGVSDCKSGIVTILRVARLLENKDYKRLTIPCVAHLSFRSPDQRNMRRVTRAQRSESAVFQKLSPTQCFFGITCRIH
jgi:glutamate carboxypeptidase